MARAFGQGFPVVPGIVLTTAAADRLAATGDAARTPRPASAAEVLPGLRRRWQSLGGEGTPMVVRSSSTIEDQSGTSMAGRFTTVVGVRGWEALLDAIATVIASRLSVGPSPTPMAVLVQPLVDSRYGGVAFGVDPVTGRSDRIVIAAVAGQPEQLVGGARSGNRYVLAADHHLTERHDPDPDAALDRRQLRSILDLTLAASRAFGGPQDIEWAIDRHGTLWLLQSRPVTTEIIGAPQGPVFGPGPVAETFPAPLSRLELDLWFEPLRTGIGDALRLSAAVPASTLAASPIGVAVNGRVAVDLALFEPDTGNWIERRLRVLRAAWRIGRLRAALPELARDLVARVDTELLGVPALAELSDRQLVALLRRLRPVLHALHGHEMLVGLLVERRLDRAGPSSAASAGLATLARSRAAGLDDAHTIARHPVVLALAPPRIGPGPRLPGPDPAAISAGGPGRDRTGSANQPGDGAGVGWVPVLREALRLRARWGQELGARAAWLLGQRLAGAGAIEEADHVRHLDLDQLELLVRSGSSGSPRSPVRPIPSDTETAPLPTRFRLTDLGHPLPEDPGARAGAGPVGAGGGRGQGPTVHDPGPGREDEIPAGAVLVVPVLRPDLAPVLGRLNGLVAGTGSVLSHLAILAREQGVPIVVDHPDPYRQLPAGALVTVDGRTGEVVVNEPDTTEGPEGRS